MDTRPGRNPDVRKVAVACQGGGGHAALTAGVLRTLLKRQPLGYRKVLTGILFVLKAGIAWDNLPAELSCGCGLAAEVSHAGGETTQEG